MGRRGHGRCRLKSRARIHHPYGARGCHTATASFGLAQAEIRIEDEVLTTPAEAALESEQIDKAMAAMGTA